MPCSILTTPASLRPGAPLFGSFRSARRPGDLCRRRSALELEIDKQYPDIHLGPGFTYDQGQDKWGLGVTFQFPF